MAHSVIFIFLFSTQIPNIGTLLCGIYVKSCDLLNRKCDHAIRGICECDDLETDSNCSKEVYNTMNIREREFWKFGQNKCGPSRCRLSMDWCPWTLWKVDPVENSANQSTKSPCSKVKESRSSKKCCVPFRQPLLSLCRSNYTEIRTDSRTRQPSSEDCSEDPGVSDADSKDSSANNDDSELWLEKVVFIGGVVLCFFIIQYILHCTRRGLRGQVPPPVHLSQVASSREAEYGDLALPVPQSTSPWNVVDPQPMLPAPSYDQTLTELTLPASPNYSRGHEGDRGSEDLASPAPPYDSQWNLQNPESENLALPAPPYLPSAPEYLPSSARPCDEELPPSYEEVMETIDISN